MERFVVASGTTEFDVITRLRAEGFIRSQTAFNFLLTLHGWHGKIQSGGYRLSKSMSAWRIASTLAQEPYQRWVSIPEGLRKEEIANLLAKKLDWDKTEIDHFLNPDPSVGMPSSEGYYFPDTYLISVDETGSKVAQRMFNQFNEKFAPLYTQALAKNIKYQTAVKIASILEREAAGGNDMPIIAGILWNRLDKNMRLEIDATIQYARGDTGSGYWAPIKVADKNIDSPYNTYRTAGLPPTPIANPGLMSLDAVIHPAETQCLFYIHDSAHKIHCAKTYDEHKKNIAKYLK